MWNDQFLPLAQRFRVIHMEAPEQVTQTRLEFREVSNK